MTEQQPSSTVVSQIHWVFLATIPFYALAGEFLPSPGQLQVELLRVVFAVLAAGNLAVAAMLRRQKLAEAAEQLRLDPENREARSRWQAGHVVPFALCESVALFGFVLRLLGGTFTEAAVFYAVAFIFLLLWRPQRHPSVQ